MIVVVPVGKTKFGGTPVRVMVTEPPQDPLSEASAVPNSSSSVAVHDDVVTLTFAGTVNVGGVVSPLLPTVTVTFCVHEALVPPRLSVAVQVISVVPAGNGSDRGRPSLLIPTTSTLLSEGLVVGVPMVAAETVASQEPDGASTDTFAGQEIVTGSLAPASRMVTV